MAVHGVLATGLIAASLGFPVLGVAQYPMIDMSSVTTTATSTTSSVVTVSTVVTGGVWYMVVSGVVRYGDWSAVPHGRQVPSDYVKDGPVAGVEVVAYRVTGVDPRGFPIMTVLAKTTTDSQGHYSLVFATNATKPVADKSVLVQVLNQYGEARKVLAEQVGAFNGDMVFSFEKVAYSLLPFSVFNVQVGQCMFFINELWIPVVVASWVLGLLGIVLRKRT